MYQCQHCIDLNMKKRRIKEMKADRENLCKRCGKAPREGGNVTCASCSEKNREAWRKKYSKKRAEKLAREKAFGKQDTDLTKRKYTKRVPITPVQMAGAVADLENFIGSLSTMSATDYLDARRELINSIIRRGGKDGNSTT